MRNILLVFRRDYMSYVSAWGFWLGLAAMPILILFGVFMGGLAASSTPVRYYAVIENSPVYGPAIEQSFVRDREEIEATLAELSAQTGIDADISAIADENISLPDFVRIDPPANTIDELRPWLLGEREVDGPDGAKPLFAAIIIPADGGKIEYWSEEINVDGLTSRLGRVSRQVARDQFLAEANVDPDILDRADDAALGIEQRRVRTVEAEAADGNDVTFADQAPRFLALGICYFMWGVLFSTGQYLLMGTIEERSNKIFDTLLTSLRLPQLLAGKLLAVLGVTFTMMGVWSLLGFVITAAGASQLPGEVRQIMYDIIGAGLQPKILVPTFFSFVFGYLIYGSIFMALGSLCDTVQEAQTLLSPLILILMMPMFMIMLAFNDPTSPIVAFVSWVPIFTPFLLILRVPNDPSIWIIVSQIGLMAVTSFVILWLSTKVYRAGAVHGAGVSDATAWMKRLIPGMGKKKSEDAN
ncbi:MAG: ABC transporter permease [Hyphomonadaceae bacterium]